MMGDKALSVSNAQFQLQPDISLCLCCRQSHHCSAMIAAGAHTDILGGKLSKLPTVH